MISFPPLLTFKISCTWNDTSSTHCMIMSANWKRRSFKSEGEFASDGVEKEEKREKGVNVFTVATTGLQLTDSNVKCVFVTCIVHVMILT